MSTDTHLTARTAFLEAGGIRYAYRQFGAPTGTPLLFLQHFRGGLDHWDPVITDGLAAGRPVILFNNAGVASSSGETPGTVDEMADHVAAFTRALGPATVDLLGFSLGGLVAQTVAVRHPELVRRLVLVGTLARNGIEEGRPDDVFEVATRNDPPSLEDFLYLFFEPSQTSQAAGRAFWERRHRRSADVDPPTSQQTMHAQLAAMLEFREARGERFSELTRIVQPTLVVNGRNDIMAPTINSYVLAQHLPNAELVVYPDSGHGAHFQFAELFTSQVARFLDAEPAFC
jgi:pimeloyl-ACP methyl ester carboxylesterase